MNGSLNFAMDVGILGTFNKPVLSILAEEPWFENWMRADSQESRRANRIEELPRDLLQVVQQIDYPPVIYCSLSPVKIRESSETSQQSCPRPGFGKGKQTQVEHLGKRKEKDHQYPTREAKRILHHTTVL